VRYKRAGSKRAEVDSGGGRLVAQQDEGSEIEPAATPSPQEDHRDRRTWWVIVAVGLVVFVVVLLLGRPLVQGRLDAARNLDRAATMISATNGDLSGIDSAVRASAKSGTAPDASVTASVVATRRTLEEAASLAQSGSASMTSDEQERAVLVRGTATTRLEALDAAEAVLSAGLDSSGAGASAQALEKYDRAVEKVREADTALVKL
jgi:hypothetical protein